MNSQTTYAPCPDCRKINRVPLDGATGRLPVCGQCKTELAVRKGINEVSASGLLALIEKSPLPLLVDFWAPWCGPCRAFAPTFEQAAARLGGQFVLAKLDTQAHPLAADTYRIRGIPTLAVFHNGFERARTSGALPLEQLLGWAQAAVSSRQAG